MEEVLLIKLILCCDVVMIFILILFCVFYDCCCCWCYYCLFEEKQSISKIIKKCYWKILHKYGIILHKIKCKKCKKSDLNCFQKSVWKIQSDSTGELPNFGYIDLVYSNRNKIKCYICKKLLDNFITTQFAGSKDQLEKCNKPNCSCKRKHYIFPELTELGSCFFTFHLAYFCPSCNIFKCIECSNTIFKRKEELNEYHYYHDIIIKCIT